MDGKVKYIGAHNDRDPILVNIGGVAAASAQQSTVGDAVMVYRGVAVQRAPTLTKPN